MGVDEMGVDEMGTYRKVCLIPPKDLQRFKGLSIQWFLQFRGHLDSLKWA